LATENSIRKSSWSFLVAEYKCAYLTTEEVSMFRGNERKGKSFKKAPNLPEN
jgi:hypothetical protein